MNWKENFYETKVKPFLKFEIEASERIKNKFNVEIVSFNDDNKYDFIDANNIKYEVKCDKYSNISGNFFIEFKGYHKNSGISNTKANYYIITNEDNYYMILTEKLLKLCKKYGNVRNTKDKLTFGYIINCNIIICNSIII